MSTVFYQCATCGELLRVETYAGEDTVYPCERIGCNGQPIPLSRAEVHAYQERFRNGEAK
jgi:hypothetical protein